MILARFYAHKLEQDKQRFNKMEAEIETLDTQYEKSLQISDSTFQVLLAATCMLKKLTVDIFLIRLSINVREWIKFKNLVLVGKNGANG